MPRKLNRIGRGNAMGAMFNALPEKDKPYVAAKAQKDYVTLPDEKKVLVTMGRFLEEQKEAIACSPGAIEDAKRDAQVRRMVEW
jgi:hypothetical protein